MRDDRSSIKPQYSFEVNRKKFSIDHRNLSLPASTVRPSAGSLFPLSDSHVVRDISKRIYLRDKLENKSLPHPRSDKIFCNPSFLTKNQNPKVNTSCGRNIHVNPYFVRNPSTVSLPSSSTAPLKQNVYFNPKFLEKQTTKTLPVSKPVDPPRCESAVLQTPLISKYSLDKRLCSRKKMPDNIKSSIPTSKPYTSSIKQNILNNKYKKVNNNFSDKLVVSNCKVHKSKYSIRRVNVKTTPVRSILVESPGNYRKIGKRKLIRKSLLQTYISSRRISTPYSVQHMRNIAQQKAVRAPVRSKYKVVHQQQSRYSKDNRIKTRQSSEFLKIGKRKIVRKSLIYSIIEARRNAAVSKKSKVVTRYKIRKVTKTSPNDSFFKKRNIQMRRQIHLRCMRDPVLLSRMSKSVMFRMRPSVRIHAKLEFKKRALLKKNNAKCLFYNRFGYCKGKDNGRCKKVHDPKSVAICKKYLLGQCSDQNCKLNHTMSKEKMPTCHQFLAGVCVRENCPFLHVKLHSASFVCREFLSGFCPNGNSCTKRHVFVCPDWDMGSCPRKVCPYPHPKPTGLKKGKAEPTLKVKTPFVSERIVKEEETDARDRYFDGVPSPRVIETLNEFQENEEIVLELKK